jgi:hypothetical protein
MLIGFQADCSPNGLPGPEGFGRLHEALICRKPAAVVLFDEWLFEYVLM